MTKYKYVTTRIINLLRSLQSPSESIFGTIKSTFQNTQFRSKRPGYQIWWDKRGSDLSVSESVSTIFQKYYVCVRVFYIFCKNAIGVSGTDSMSAAARATRAVPLTKCPQFQILARPCPRIDCPCPLTTVRVAALEQISRCVGHGGIRLYHQKIFSIERRVTNEKLLKNRFLSFVQNHFWSFLALLIKRRSLSPFEMTISKSQ